MELYPLESSSPHHRPLHPLNVLMCIALLLSHASLLFIIAIGIYTGSSTMGA